MTEKKHTRDDNLQFLFKLQVLIASILIRTFVSKLTDFLILFVFNSSSNPHFPRSHSLKIQIIVFLNISPLMTTSNDDIINGCSEYVI